MAQWARTATGLMWECVGKALPTDGVHITDRELVETLREAINSTQGGGKLIHIDRSKWEQTSRELLHRDHFCWLEGKFYRPREAGTISGRAPEPVGVRIVVDIPARRGGSRGERAATGHRRRAEARGERSMRDGRWAVAEVKEAQKLRTGGVVVKVRFEGDEHDEWVALRGMSRDLKALARGLLPEPRQKVSRPRRAVREGERRSCRVRQALERKHEETRNTEGGSS